MSRGKSAKSLELIEASHEILQEIHPATVRAVCYPLFNQRLIPNMEKTSTNRVSTQLTYARKNGLIPWPWIVDEHRELERIASWANADGYMATLRRDYRRDHWDLQPRRVEVWSEKGTVRGTLGPVLDEYGVGFRVFHGYSSTTVVHDVAEESLISRPLTVLYIGDWDPSGLHMSEVDLPGRLAEYSARHVEIERIALTEADVLGGDLPHFDVRTKKKDSRFNWYMARYGPLCGYRAWELDALSPNILRDRVRAAIRAAIAWSTWRRSVRAETAETESLQTVLDAWNGR